MAQYLKEDIQEKIAEAALRVFAERGYASATVAEIGRAAGVSTGNIYRYFENKDELFLAVVDDTFVRTFASLLRRRVEALAGTSDIGDLPESAPYHLASEELLRFCLEHRLRVVIALGRSRGSRHEGFAERTVSDLILMAIAHFRGLHPALQVTDAMRFNLAQIYENLVASMVKILAAFEGEADIRAAVSGYNKYHLAGLKFFFTR